MDVVEEEELRKSVHDEIVKNKQELYHNLIRVESMKDTNEDMKSVVDEYAKYFTFMKAQKQEHERQLLFILQYLEKILQENKTSEYEARHVQEQQQQLFHQLEHVKKDIDQFMKDPEAEPEPEA